MTSDHRFQSLELRELRLDDESAFLKWFDSWKNEDPHWATFIWKPEMSHAEHIQKLIDYKDPSKIADHLVPSTMFYAFVEDEIVGRLSVRHYLNENLQKRGGHIGYSVSPNHRRKGYAKQMFRQSLVYCKKIGLQRLLITCDDKNEASWRVIESFGGSLENRFTDLENNQVIRRYWVEVKEE